MQSTGQTSTHERSLVPMHGSVIVYVTGGSLPARNRSLQGHCRYGDCASEGGLESDICVNSGSDRTDGRLYKRQCQTEVTMLRPGDAAPDFELNDENGTAVRLSDFMGKSPVVLMFYPADNTPGCTKQLCTARDDFDKYQQQGIQVFGVNPGSPGTHKRFAERHGMRTPLLVDTGGAVSRK